MTEKLYCSSCSQFQVAEDFGKKKNGKHYKTCNRHNKKRSLQLDDWNDFMELLKNWKKGSEDEVIDGQFTFSLDALPVQFGSLSIPRISEDDGNNDDSSAFVRLR
ncbi:hypothetical protein V1514DRAFT_184931 [Lipomyces japonicus]|uniref:uncharacterized protein n=1 Tax=Lipomyces japonicus TaxID=56871 RepID=UPI0034CFC032